MIVNTETPGIYIVPQTKDKIRQQVFTRAGEIERALAALQMSLNEIDAAHICSSHNKQLFSQINHQLGLLPKSSPIDCEN